MGRRRLRMPASRQVTRCYLEDFIRQASGACSQEDDALMYAAGFEFSRRFAVEAGWIRHRALEAVVTFPAFLPTAGSRPIREASTRCRPSMARPWDGCRWTGGALRQAGRVLLEAEDQGEPCDGSVVDDEDVAPLVGVGADVAWNERWRMRGEWLGQTGGKAHAFLGGIAYRF